MAAHREAYGRLVLKELGGREEPFCVTTLQGGGEKVAVTVATSGNKRPHRVNRIWDPYVVESLDLKELS